MTLVDILMPVVWATAAHLAMWTAGSWLRGVILGQSDVDEAPSFRAFQSALLGFALLGTGAFALGAAGWLHPVLVGSVVAGLAVGGVIRIARSRPRLPRRPTLADLPLWASVAFVLAHLPNAIYPLLEHDENVYHLLLPKLYLESHRLLPLPWSLGANMPHLVDLSYAIPSALGGFTAAKVFVLGFFLWTIAGLASFGRERLGPIGPGVLAALYLSGRVIQWHFGLAYVEPVIGALLLGAVLALEAWWRERRPGHLRVLAVLAGAACASKYTVWPLTVVLLAIVAIARAPSGRRAGIRQLAVMAGIIAIIVAPLLVKNALVTGNPVFPTLPAVFENPYWTPTQDVQFQHEMGYGRGADRHLVSYLGLPYRLVTEPYTGLLGTAAFSATSIILLAASMLFPWRRGSFDNVLRILSIAGFVFWCLGSKQGRYLVAWLPVMILTASIALAPLKRWRGALAGATIVIAAVAVVQIRLQGFPVAPVGDIVKVPKPEILSRNLCWELTEFLNREVPADGRVLSFWENRLYFLDRPFVTDSAYGAPTVLSRLREAGDARTFAQTCIAEGFTHVVINPYHYKAYMGNGYLYSLFDAEYYPPGQLAADHALLDRFVNEELEPVDWNGGWAVFTLKGAKARR